MNTTNKRPNYGIDAPGVIRNIFIIALITGILAVVAIYVHISFIQIKPETFLGISISCVFSASLMLLYSLHGKYKYREKILNLVSWSGRENVLDIGTGKGLLMVGAAKRLSDGRSYGIDIWNKQDLTGNNAEKAMINATREGVAGKIEIANENVTDMSFDNDFFDLIFSNLVLHNIYKKKGRIKACKEIFRVLKPGGTVVISDFRHTGEYKNEFKKLGMKTEKIGTSYFDTFPPLTIIIAVKQSGI